jgi:hypothetical protein
MEKRATPTGGNINYSNQLVAKVCQDLLRPRRNAAFPIIDVINQPA